jgi:hypothetical protein
LVSVTTWARNELLDDEPGLLGELLRLVVFDSTRSDEGRVDGLRGGCGRVGAVGRARGDVRGRLLDGVPLCRSLDPELELAFFDALCPMTVLDAGSRCASVV